MKKDLSIYFPPNTKKLHIIPLTDTCHKKCTVAKHYEMTTLTTIYDIEEADRRVACGQGLGWHTWSNGLSTVDVDKLTDTQLLMAKHYTNCNCSVQKTANGYHFLYAATTDIDGKGETISNLGFNLTYRGHHFYIAVYPSIGKEWVKFIHPHQKDANYAPFPEALKPMKGTKVIDYATTLSYIIATIRQEPTLRQQFPEIANGRNIDMWLSHFFRMECNLSLAEVSALFSIIYGSQYEDNTTESVYESAERETVQTIGKLKQIIHEQYESELGWIITNVISKCEKKVTPITAPQIEQQEGQRRRIKMDKLLAASAYVDSNNISVNDGMMQQIKDHVLTTVHSNGDKSSPVVRDFSAILTPEHWSSGLLNEMLAFCYATKSTDIEIKANGFMTSNGYFIDTNTFDIRQPLDTDVASAKINTVYDPNATCPQWETFMSQVFPDRHPEMMTFYAQWFAYCLMPHSKAHKFIIQQGGGRNGKGVINEILQSIIGSNLCSYTSIEHLDETSFMLKSICGKLVNIANEIKSHTKINDATIKTIAAGERVQCNVKCADSIQFAATTKMVFNTNHTLTSQDRTRAFMSRAIIIPFEVSFEGREDTGLTEKLKTELSGILNMMIRYGKQLVDDNYRFIGQDEIVAISMEAHTEADPVYQFLASHLFWGIADNKPCVTNQEIYKEYQTYMKNTGGNAVSMVKFMTELRAKVPCLKSDKNYNYKGDRAVRQVILRREFDPGTKDWGTYSSVISCTRDEYFSSSVDDNTRVTAAEILSLEKEASRLQARLDIAKSANPEAARHAEIAQNLDDFETSFVTGMDNPALDLMMGGK